MDTRYPPARSHTDTMRVMDVPREPRAFRDQCQVHARIARLREPHVAPLNACACVKTRLVNDMRSILSAEELKAVVGLLARVMRVPVQPLPADWCCQRSLAANESN